MGVSGLPEGAAPPPALQHPPKQHAKSIGVGSLPCGAAPLPALQHPPAQQRRFRERTLQSNRRSAAFETFGLERTVDCAMPAQEMDDSDATARFADEAHLPCF